MFLIRLLALLHGSTHTDIAYHITKYYISYYINDCIPYKKIAEYTGQTRPNAIRSVKKINSLMDVDSQLEVEVAALYSHCEKHLKKIQYAEIKI